jgi:tripartite-type tricarboxylate transporter receptor subunit TctC
LTKTTGTFRRTLIAGALAAVAALPVRGMAQGAWPSRPIKLVVPFAVSGSNDNIARVLATKLQARVRQPVVVENRGGGGGMLGTDAVAKAAPDGYTLLVVSTSLTTNAASGKKLPYDPVNDLEPIGLIAVSPFAIVVGNAVNANTLKEFLDLARAKPRTINYGSAGIGGINHLGTELFASAAGIQMTHVPYKGISLAFTDLMGGNLQMLVPSLASVVPYVRGGKMRTLAVTGARRSPLAPEIPTVSESGVPGFRLEVWFGLMAPARTPAAILKRLNEELNAILALPDMQALLAREGATPQPGTPAEFRAVVQGDLARWTGLIKDSNIQVE